MSPLLTASKPVRKRCVCCEKTEKAIAQPATVTDHLQEKQECINNSPPTTDTSVEHVNDNLKTFSSVLSAGLTFIFEFGQYIRISHLQMFMLLLIIAVILINS